MCDTILYSINSTGAQTVKDLPNINTDTVTANDITVINNITTNSLNTSTILSTDITSNTVTSAVFTGVDLTISNIFIDPKDIITDAFPYIFTITSRAGKLTLSPVNILPGNDLGLTINYANKQTDDVIFFQPYIFNSAVTDISVNIISDNPTNWIVQVTNNDPAVSYIVDLTLNYLIV